MQILGFAVMAMVAAGASLPATAPIPLAVALQATADPQAVLRAVVDNLRGGAGKATITLTVVRPDRQTEYVLAIWTDGQDRGLVQVKAPAREAGQAFLRIGENLWIYNPRLKRTLRLPPSGRTESFLGSDVSYSDLSGRDLEQDYTPRIAADDGTTVVLELLPKPAAPTPYGKVVVRAEARTFAPLEWVLYDQRGQPVKRLTFAAHVKIGARVFPARIVVEDVLRPGYRTTAVYTEMRFGIPVPEACFTQRALEQGCE
jgi:outer membrane lipoprotein-sorting protein